MWFLSVHKMSIERHTRCGAPRLLAGLALLAARLLGCRFLWKWGHRPTSVARIARLARRSRRLCDCLQPARKVCLIPRAREPAHLHDPIAVTASLLVDRHHVCVRSCPNATRATALLSIYPSICRDNHNNNNNRYNVLHVLLCCCCRL